MPMKIPPRGRLALLIAVSFALAAPEAPGQEPAAKIPIHGDAGPGLEAIDRAVLRVMQQRGIPGASLAVAKDGALVLAKGYGWADRRAGEPVRPETLFALASVSKSLTAATILKLADEGRLDLDAKAFDLLPGLKPLPGEMADPRLKDITVRQLLLHSGGWDRSKSGDPNGFSDRVAAKMKVPTPVSPEQLARYMIGCPLDFKPGTEVQYSNFGYIVLGLVIEQVTAKPYEEAVRGTLLRPMKLARVTLNHERGKGYRPGEAHRYPPNGAEDAGGHLPITMASGGWLAAPSDMVFFLTALDGTRGPGFLSKGMSNAMTARPPRPLKPRPNGTYPGLGWDVVRPVPSRGVSYQKNGGLPGVHALLKHDANGLDWFFCCNGGTGGEDGNVLPQMVKEMEEAMAEVKKWPSIDLFERPPYKPSP